MFRRLFGRAAPPQPDTSEWWREAEAAALHPHADRIAALRTGMVDAAISPDIAEAQEEMLDALERLLALAQRPALPLVPTQHRVIGQSPCHFLAPASLIDQVDASGKLFVTGERLVFAAGQVQQWPWHSVTALARADRDLCLVVRGRADEVRLRMNTYGDALEVLALAERLRANRT